MSESEILEARAYCSWEWDCPVCGEPIDAGEEQPYGEYECVYCNQLVHVS